MPRPADIDIMSASYGGGRSAEMSGEKRVGREVRIILERRARASGRRTAAELYANMGGVYRPGLISQFEHTTRRVLRSSRIEGQSETLISDLVELWNMAFKVEMRRQLRSGGKAIV